MSAHGLLDDDAAPSPPRHVRRNGLLQLGWPHFWLLTGILGGTLALLVLILLAAAISR
jgi:hypothetical protein